MDARQPNQDPRVVAVVVGKVVRVRVGGQQFFALIEIHANYQRLAVLAQAGDQLAANLERRRAVRRAFLDVLQRQRNFANVIERHREFNAAAYLPTTTIEKLSGTMAPRPPPRPPAGGGVAGAGGGANPAVVSRGFLVLLSRGPVLARTRLCQGR